MSTMRVPASVKSFLRSIWVARVVPLPGRARPMASLRQFMEFAVNMPAQEPQVGHALASMLASWLSLTESSTAMTMASMRSRRCSTTPSTAAPDSMGPPETKMVGMFRRMAARSMPGVILSQLEMHTRASARCALTMVSTQSAMRSRLGRE